MLQLARFPLPAGTALDLNRLAKVAPRRKPSRPHFRANYLRGLNILPAQAVHADKSFVSRTLYIQFSKSCLVDLLKVYKNIVQRLYPLHCQGFINILLTVLLTLLRRGVLYPRLRLRYRRGFTTSSIN